MKPHSNRPKGKMDAIAWMVHHPVSANLLMVLFLIGGALSWHRIRQEVFPEFSMDMVQVSVRYPGASPEDVEQGIVLVIEEAVRGVEGVVEITSVASEGNGSVNIEYDPKTNSQQFYQDIKQEIDRIRTFPDDAEKPSVSLLTRRRDVLEIHLYGDVDEFTLRNLTEEVRERLLDDPRINLAELEGARNLEIHIQPTIDALRQYGLTFGEVASIVARTAVEIPGGSVDTSGGEILLRFNERKDYAFEFARIPIIQDPVGGTVYLGDLARVEEAFEDVDELATFNGKRAIGISIFRIGDQGPIEVAKAAREIIESIAPSLPEGVNYSVMDDNSIIYKQRLELLSRNMLFGLVLVLVTLGLFLEIRLAFWVTMGIPISFLGALLFFPDLGVSINMISMFAFIIALGIVVDDAIVVGENIFEYRQLGMSPLHAAIRGTREVSSPVVFAILTNMVAFLPLMMIPGMMGKIWKVIPVVVCLVFTISLIEALYILPAHLAHLKSHPDTGWMHRIHTFQQVISNWVRNAIYKGYAPLLDRCIRHRYIVVAMSITILAIVMSYALSGRITLTLMPRVESDYAFTSVNMPLGTPMSSMIEVKDLIEKKAFELIQNNGADQLSEGVFTRIRENSVESRIYLTPPEIRPKSTSEITKLWREAVGEIPGSERTRFESSRGGPGGGDSLTIELAHSNINTLEQASTSLAAALGDFPVVKNIDDGYNPGKLQFELSLLEQGRSLGLSSQMVAAQIRSAFFGAVSLRQQRGRNEVEVRVKLPETDANSIAHLEELMIQTPSGSYVPLKQIATFDLGRAYRSIDRRDGRRTLTVSANVDPEDETSRLVEQLQAETIPQLIQDHPGLSVSFQGRQSDMADSMGALKQGLLITVILLFALLAIPFNSYVQPLIVMVALPFGIVGAILGHLIMGFNLSVISLMGIIALCGVVINDALVMIVFANEQRKEGKSAFEAIHNAGVRRFRPILLTTMTTFGGLAPMIFETSRQARFMIPMAISLGYGLLFATAITLVLVPSLYLMVEDIRKWLGMDRPQTTADTSEIPTTH
jgi:multidrug efflux pump subunit AcrB